MTYATSCGIRSGLPHRLGGPATNRLLAVLSLLLATAACERPRPPAAPEAPPPPVPSPAAAPPPDAEPPARDAGGDAGVIGGGVPVPRAAAPRRAAPPAGDGGDARGVKVEGNLARPAAEKVVRAGAAKLKACYEQERSRNPTLHGRVTFRLTVDDRGRVPLGEVVTSTLGGGDPEMCMVQAARDFRFPSGSGDSTVSFQITFGH
jgi:hypothetical protein